MPDATLEQTPLAHEIITKTSEAMKGMGFDAGFDADVEAAFAKDAEASKLMAGAPRTAPEADAELEKALQPQPAVKPKAEPKKEPLPQVEDIPEALVTPKKDSPAVPTDDEREKFIAEQTKGMSPKATDRFRAQEKAKHDAEVRAARVPELEKELATYKSQKPDTSEVESLRKQVSELDEKLAKVALTEHPKFKAHFVDKLQAEIDIAKGAAGEHKAEVAVLLELPDSKERNRRLSELAETLDDFERGKLMRAVDNVDRINADKTKELANWKENKVRMDDMSRKEQEEATARRQQEVEYAYKAVEKKITDEKEGIELFRKVEGNDEWNAKVDRRLESVRKINDVNLGPREISEMAALSISGTEFRRLFLTQRVLVKRLQDELASLRGTEPNLGVGSGAVEKEDLSDTSIDGMVARAVKAGIVR